MSPCVLNCREHGVPDGAVYVGRAMPRQKITGSKFANPFRIYRDQPREQVIELYRTWLLSKPDLVEKARQELQGKDLVCWCAPLPCHADVLLEIANGEVQS